MKKRFVAMLVILVVALTIVTPTASATPNSQRCVKVISHNGCQVVSEAAQIIALSFPAVPVSPHVKTKYCQGFIDVNKDGICDNQDTQRHKSRHHGYGHSYRHQC